MATATAKKKKKSKGKSSISSGGGSSGFGKVTAPRLTAQQILDDATETYAELESIMYGRDMKWDGCTDEQVSDFLEGVQISEWVIAMRSNSSVSRKFQDWVPVASLILCNHRMADAKRILPAAIGARSKPILIGASDSEPIIKQFDPSSLEFAFEPMSSFEQYVVDGWENQSKKVKQAMATLGVSSTDKAEVRSAWAKIAGTAHPDVSGTEEGPVRKRFDEAMEAYRLLSVRNIDSFYASLGGFNRASQFSGALSREAVGPLGKQRPEQTQGLKFGGWQAGVRPMSRDLMNVFVSTNLFKKYM